MASLFDVADVPRTVEVLGKDVAVPGVSGNGIASLLRRFPVIQKMFTGEAITKEALMEHAPEAVAAIIAAGTGYPGDKDVEAIASQLSIGYQVALLDKVIEATFPKGVGPFVEQLKALGVLAEARNPSTSRSPEPQKSSSQSDTETPSPTPPDK